MSKRIMFYKLLVKLTTGVNDDTNSFISTALPKQTVIMSDEFEGKVYVRCKDRKMSYVNNFSEIQLKPDFVENNGSIFDPISI